MTNVYLPVIVEIVSCFLLLYIAFEDFRYRGVSWYLFIGLTLASFCEGYLFFSGDIWQNWLFNTVFVAVQLAFVSIYFSLKHKKWINITNVYLGWGDILFLGISALVFEPAMYIVFYISSLLGTLSLVLAYRVITKSNEKTIPLAGIQALFLLVYLIICHHFPDLLKDLVSF